MGINLSAGFVNAVEICCTAYKAPTMDTLLTAFKETLPRSRAKPQVAAALKAEMSSLERSDTIDPSMIFDTIKDTIESVEVEPIDITGKRSTKADRLRIKDWMDNVYGEDDAPISVPTYGNKEDSGWEGVTEWGEVDEDDVAVEVDE